MAQVLLCADGRHRLPLEYLPERAEEHLRELLHQLGEPFRGAVPVRGDTGR
jgi:hypothetical protein